MKKIQMFIIITTALLANIALADCPDMFTSCANRDSQDSRSPTPQELAALMNQGQNNGGASYSQGGGGSTSSNTEAKKQQCNTDVSGAIAKFNDCNSTAYSTSAFQKQYGCPALGQGAESCLASLPDRLAADLNTCKGNFNTALGGLNNRCGGLVAVPAYVY